MIELDDLPIKLTDNTTHGNDVGLDISIIEGIWNRSTVADSQFELLRTLKNLKIGIREVENDAQNLSI